MNVLEGPRIETRRILHEGTPQWVTLVGDEFVAGDGRRVREADAVYLAPCDPTKILCIHLNYESRRIEFQAPPLTTPTYFQKPNTALNAHRGTLCRPANCQYLNYEGEIAAVVGRPMRNVAQGDVWDHLAGFAPANDVGAQDFRDTDAGSMLRVKGQDGFCPIGPGLVRGVDVRESTRAHDPEREDGAGGQGLGDDLPDRLHPRRPVPPHHAAAGRHRPDGDARELAADAAGRHRRSRSHGHRAAHESRDRGARAEARGGASADGYQDRALGCARQRFAQEPRRVSAGGAPSRGFVRNLWYVAAWSHELPVDTPISRTIIGEPLALYRKRDGSVVALEDRCAHRHAPLSLGRIEGDDLRCMYHGLRFGCDGACKEMPGRAEPPRLAVRSYPAVERWSWLWVWLGEPAKADPARIPEAFGLDDARFMMRADAMDYDANWELLNDNLCDLSHLDFSHETTLGGSSGVQWSRELPRITEIDDGLQIDRWYPNSEFTGRAGRTDTLNSYRYLLPGVFLMTTAWYPLGAAERCAYGVPDEKPLSRRVEQQAVTPVSEKRSRYLYATGFAAEFARPELVEGIFAIVNEAFAEDKRILEGQQRIWELTPAGTRMSSTPHDAAPLAFRRLVAKRLAEEQSA